MSGTARIIANQSHLIRALKLDSAKVRLYVREESHESGMSTTQLARRLSEGWTTEEGIVVPPRPFLKEFFAENKAEIVLMIQERGVKGVEAIADYLLTMFQAWVVMGGVKPENSAYTISQKGQDKAPLYDTGALLASIKSEGTYVKAK